MSGKGLNIPDAELRDFVPPYGSKSKCARVLFAELKAAGWTVKVRSCRRRRNEASEDPDKGRIRALSSRLSSLRGVEYEMKGTRVASDTRIKHFSRE